MKINRHKLAEIIETDLAAITAGVMKSSDFCIGETNGIQVQIRLTKDESEFHSFVNPKLNCID